MIQDDEHADYRDARRPGVLSTRKSMHSQRGDSVWGEGLDLFEDRPLRRRRFHGVRADHRQSSGCDDYIGVPGVLAQMHL